MPLLDKGHAYVNRYREIADVLIRHGFGYIVDRIGLRPFRSVREKLFGPRPLKEQLLILSEAERLRLAFEELGPTFIKFGQILSTRHDLIPGEYIKELSKLQDRVPAFDYSEAKVCVEKEFGKNIEEIFETFDPEPIAAASIGQVYYARLSGGEEVAVKVIRPGIEEIIEIDLFILNSLARFAEKHIKESKFFNPVGYIQEFSRIMRQEVDYTHEAQNADKFYINFKESTCVRIPKVYWNFTTKRILTLEFIEGIKISDKVRLKEAGLDNRKISNDLANAYLKMIFEDGFYHADPHPGNIFISRDGSIIFFDFGMAGYVDPVLRENLVNLMIATMKNDLDLLAETLSSIGLIYGAGNESHFLRVNLEEFIHHYYRLTTKYIDPTTFLRDLIEVLIKSGGKIPTNIMLLSKTLIIRDEISRELYPEHNFAELVEPYVKKMIKERTSVYFNLRETEKIVRDIVNMFRVFPGKVTHILTRAEKGMLKLELDHPAIDSLSDELDVTSNRLSFSMIISALIIGSSLIIQTGMSPRIFSVPLLGIFGFLLAGFLGLGLLLSILRSGKW